MDEEPGLVASVEHINRWNTTLRDGGTTADQMGSINTREQLEKTMSNHLAFLQSVGLPPHTPDVEPEPGERGELSVERADGTTEPLFLKIPREIELRLDRAKFYLYVSKLHASGDMTPEVHNTVHSLLRDAYRHAGKDLDSGVPVEEISELREPSLRRRARALSRTQSQAPSIRQTCGTASSSGRRIRRRVSKSSVSGVVRCSRREIFLPSKVAYRYDSGALRG